MTNSRTLILCLMLASAAGTAQEAPPRKVSRTISVLGSGLVTVVPDLVRISIQIRTQKEPSPADAVSKVNGPASAVMDILKKYSVSESDMQTRRVSIDPVYEMNTPRVVSGYAAEIEISASLRNLDAVGKILDEAVKAGATGFGPLFYRTSRENELKREALVNAADDAKAKAEVLAKRFGGSVGKVISTTEAGVRVPSEGRLLAASQSSGVPFVAGEMEIHASIEVVFELK